MNKKIKVTFEQENKKAIVDMEFEKDNRVQVNISFIPEIHGNEKEEYLWALNQFIRILEK